MNHFGKICRKQNRKRNARTRKKTVNVVEEESQPDDSVICVQSSPENGP